MCLMNKLSGLETQQTSQLATNAHAKGVADLGRAGKSGSRPGNISRDLVRTILRNVKEPAPEPYFAEILTHNPATKQDRYPVQIPFLLVHEMMAMMCRQDSDFARTLSTLKDPYSELRDDVCSSFRCEKASTIGLGFHGDGVPHQKIAVSMCSHGMPSQPRHQTEFSLDPYQVSSSAGAVAVAGAPLMGSRTSSSGV